MGYQAYKVCPKPHNSSVLLYSTVLLKVHYLIVFSVKDTYCTALNLAKTWLKHFGTAIELRVHLLYHKGVIGCKIHFYKLFEHKCVLEVCVHIHPIMIKIHPVFFFLIPILKSPFSNQAVLGFLSEWHSSVQAAPTIVDWHGRLTLDPPWVSWELSAIVSTPVQGKTRCLRLSNWGVLMLDVIMTIAVVIYSRHLSRWRRRDLMLLSFLGRESRECGDKCVYVCANHSWSSFIYRRSEYKVFFMNLCKSPFLIMC